MSKIVLRMHMSQSMARDDFRSLHGKRKFAWLAEQEGGVWQASASDDKKDRPVYPWVIRAGTENTPTAPKPPFDPFAAACIFIPLIKEEDEGITTVERLERMLERAKEEAHG